MTPTTSTLVNDTCDCNDPLLIRYMNIYYENKYFSILFYFSCYSTLPFTSSEDIYMDVVDLNNTRLNRKWTLVVKHLKDVRSCV